MQIMPCGSINPAASLGAPIFFWNPWARLLGGERVTLGSACLTDICRLEGGVPGDGFLRHPLSGDDIFLDPLVSPP